MLKVAICDDENLICAQVEKYIFSICKKADIKADVDVFYSGEELCRGLKNGEYYDLIFLDIELPQLNGIEVGHIIREVLENENMQIAYISGRENYAIRLFEFRPINFLVKPLDYQKVEQVLKKVFLLLDIETGTFTYKKGHGIDKIQIKDILYFQSRNRKIEIITQNSSEEFYGSLDDVYEQVKKNQFLWIHKSYIVNYKFVKILEYDQLTMTNGQVLSISQNKRKYIREMQLKFKRGEM